MEDEIFEYRVIDTKSGIDYLENHGMSIMNSSDEQIKSGSGAIYLLPNKKVLLLPTNFDLKYPAIIFKDHKTFIHFKEEDFFPIGNENMSWLERHEGQIKKFRESPSFYRDVLQTKLRIKLPFKDEESMKMAFVELHTLLHSNEVHLSNASVDELINSFGMEMINYIIEIKKYELLFRDEYENYNPYTRIILENNRVLYDVLSTCFIGFRNPSSNAALLFINMTCHS